MEPIGFLDQVVQKTGSPTYLTKAQLYAWRDDLWGASTVGSNIISMTLGLGGFAQCLGIPAYLLSASIGFLGLGTSLGDQVDNILTHNNCEGGKVIRVTSELTYNFSCTELKKVRVIKIQVH